MSTDFGICNLSLVPMRLEPSDRSEQVSQLLFGEHFKVLERQEKWVKIASAHDDYEGWIDPKQYLPISEEDYEQLNNPLPFVAIDFINPLKDEKNRCVNLLQGSTLPFFDGLNLCLNEQKFEFFGKAVQVNSLNLENAIEEYAMGYLSAPYLWGGRSPFGIDCSGFTQVVYKVFGGRLKRDASQQVEQGRIVNFLEEAQPGDLAFFDNEEGKIIHVGIILSDNRIIHASGQVRVDGIDHHGIFNSTTKKYSHNLRIIKRVV